MSPARKRSRSSKKAQQLVGLAVDLAALDDERPPNTADKTNRRLGRQAALPGSVEGSQRVDGIEDRLG
jgi:hypothetical protein